MLTTQIRVEGANCPVCFNATIEALRKSAGVDQVTASETEGWLRIDHSTDDVAGLVSTVREHLHAATMANAEIVMTSVEPIVVDMYCSDCGHHEHHDPPTGQPATPT